MEKADAPEPVIDDGDLAELERYLRDKVADLVQGGLDPEEAFRAAEAEFERPARSTRPTGRPAQPAPPDGSPGDGSASRRRFSQATSASPSGV